MARLRSLGFAAFGAVVAFGALACGPNISQPAPTPECSAGAGYDFAKPFVDASVLTLPAPGMDLGSTPPGFDFGDTTPNAVLKWGAVAVDPAETCGRPQVLDMQSEGHNDYGASFFMSLNGFDATGAEGIAFWAKSPVVASDKSVILELSDRRSDAAGMICKVYPPQVDAPIASTDTTTITTTVGSNASNTPGYVPYPDECGNLFAVNAHFTNVWQLYLVPFASFAQAALPNRNPNGVDSSGLYEFAVEVPKEAHFELWIDQIGVYQPSSAAAGP